jgi:DNA invertase Pin-like site-specific DNA recombinase
MLSMRVIVAGRLSRKVADRDQTGLDSQEREAVRWAEAEGHEVVAVVADFKSGRSGLESRPQLRPWVTQPEKLREYDAIVALKVDRLTRGSRAETTLLEQWARDHGKTLMIASAGVRFPSEGVDGIQWDLMLRIAHQEWLAISERYLRMQRTLKERGSAVGLPPWGFEIRKLDGRKVFEPTPQCRACAPVIFQMAISGRSLREIASWMDSQGIVTRNGKSWHEGHIAAHILRNPVYKGMRRGAGALSPVTEAVVSGRDWSAAGEAIAARNRAIPGERKYRKALLSPVCGNPECDATGLDLGPSPMYAIRTGRAGGYAYYRCSGRGPQRRGCGACLIPTSELESAVAAAMRANQQWHYEPRYVAGDDNADRIERLRGLAAVAVSRAGMLAIWDEIEALEALDPAPGGWVNEKTPLTKAMFWESLDEEGQRGYLAQLVIWVFKADGLITVSIT